MKINKGVQRKPRRILLYGTHGIGKSTWAAQAPSPIFVPTEDGVNDIEVDKFDLCKSLGTFNAALSYLSTENHPYRTVVVDTLDWLERLVFTQTAQDIGKKSIEEIAYGKGYILAVRHWDFIMQSLDNLRLARGMGIILLAHAKISKFQPPDSDTYNRYEPDLHATSSSMLQEWCDEVLFACYRVSTVKRDEGFNRERTRAVGDGERIAWTAERPTHYAKRRVFLPDTLPLDFGAYLQALVASRKPAEKQPEAIQGVAEVKEKQAEVDQVLSTGPANIEGIVVDGSSKAHAQPVAVADEDNPF